MVAGEGVATLDLAVMGRLLSTAELSRKGVEGENSNSHDLYGLQALDMARIPFRHFDICAGREIRTPKTLAAARWTQCVYRFHHPGGTGVIGGPRTHDLFHGTEVLCQSELLSHFGGAQLSVASHKLIELVKGGFGKTPKPGREFPAPHLFIALSRLLRCAA